LSRGRGTGAQGPTRAAVLAGVCVLIISRGAAAATLPNELPRADISVAARGGCGPFFRPGAWMTLRVEVDNSGDPFMASVRVRESRGGAETLFHSAGPRELARGTNSFDILLAPGDASAGTTLEIADRSNDDKVVFRSPLSRILRPLARSERLFVTVGAMPVPVRGDGGARVWAMEPGDMPTGREAYGPVDALVIGAMARSAVSTAQVRALLAYALGGGRIVFSSLRALEVFTHVVFGADARAPRGPGELMAALPPARVRSGTEADPRVVEFPLGSGRCAVLAGEPDDRSPWLAEETGQLLDGSSADSFLGPARADALVDAAAFGALGSDRPFARASARARTIAIVGALLVTVCAVLLAGRRRAIAGVVLGGAVAAWALVALLVWREPVAVARIVRVRAVSADGRAEVVTDTAALMAFDREATLSFETPTGPPLPVARRPGRAFDEPFELRERAGVWRLSSLNVSPASPYLVRATGTREVDPNAEALRGLVLADGARLRVTTLPGGGRKLSGAETLPRDVRYLLERFAPPCDTLAWSWSDGAPEGASAPECDIAPGSGVLVIAGIPAANESD